VNALIFRRCSAQEDFEGIAEVFSRVYNSGNPVEADEIRQKPYASYLGRRDGMPVCGFAVLDFQSQVREAVIPCGGVAAVGVLPEHRRSGAGTELMRFAVQEMRRYGQPIGSLYAFRESFYRRFGFEVAGKRLGFKAPIERLHRLDSALAIRKIGPDDWKEIDPCYREFARTRSGLNLRDEVLWRRVLAENRPLAIYVAGDPIEAYAVISHSGGFWTHDHVSELAWSSLQGHQSMVDFIRGLGINKRSFQWYEPSDSPSYAYLLDEGIEVGVQRPVMWRVNDVPSALTLLKPAGEGRAVIEIDDDLIGENCGPWDVTWNEGRVRVERTDQTGIGLTIREFTQAFMGEPSVDDFVRWGRLDADDPNVAGLRLLIPPRPVYCLDFF